MVKQKEPNGTARCRAAHLLDDESKIVSRSVCSGRRWLLKPDLNSAELQVLKLQQERQSSPDCGTKSGLRLFNRTYHLNRGANSEAQTASALQAPCELDYRPVFDDLRPRTT